MRLVCVTDGSTTAEGDLDQQTFLVGVPQMRDPFLINFYLKFVVYFNFSKMQYILGKQNISQIYLKLHKENALIK